MPLIILFVGLGLILIAAVVARIQERPTADRRALEHKSGILPETDLQVEGLARAGELPAAIAMYSRTHRVDNKAARRAVAVLAQGGTPPRPDRPSLSPKTKIGQIMLSHLERMKDSNL
jgi:hypothetical protein